MLPPNIFNIFDGDDIIFVLFLRVYVHVPIIIMYFSKN